MLIPVNLASQSDQTAPPNDASYSCCFGSARSGAVGVIGLDAVDASCGLSSSSPYRCRSRNSAECPNGKSIRRNACPMPVIEPNMEDSGLTVEFHKAALQPTSTESHCRHWRRKSLRQVCRHCCHTALSCRIRNCYRSVHF